MDYSVVMHVHKILMFGHSYVRHLGLYCCARGLYNFGLPDWYDIDLIGISGAKVSAFEAWASRIVDALPGLLIIDIGGNDLSSSEVPETEVAADLLLYVQKILDRIPPYIRPRAVILEQHRRSHIRGLDSNYVAYSRHLAKWHSCIVALYRIDSCIDSSSRMGFT